MEGAYAHPQIRFSAKFWSTITDALSRRKIVVESVIVEQVRSSQAHQPVLIRVTVVRFRCLQMCSGAEFPFQITEHVYLSQLGSLERSDALRRTRFWRRGDGVPSKN